VCCHATSFCLGRALGRRLGGGRPGRVIVEGIEGALALVGLDDRGSGPHVAICDQDGAVPVPSERGKEAAHFLVDGGARHVGVERGEKVGRSVCLSVSSSES
jgi:hypothetical protein